MKFVISATICFISVMCSAQLEKGAWLVGGNGSVNSFEQTYETSLLNTGNKARHLDLSASIGYFVIQKLAVGIKPGFSWHKERNADSHLHSKSLVVGPYVRYYFLSLEKQFNVLADASYQFGTSIASYRPKRKGPITDFSFMAGPEIFLNSVVGFEMLVGYNYQRETIKEPGFYKYTRKGFLVTFGFQLHLEQL